MAVVGPLGDEEANDGADDYCQEEGCQRAAAVVEHEVANGETGEGPNRDVGVRAGPAVTDFVAMRVEVVPADPQWSRQFEQVAATLAEALSKAGIESRVEHVGSTSVPGLPSKPVLDIDILVDADDLEQAIARLEAVGYRHRGDLGVTGREAFVAPDERPRRNVYLSTSDNLHVRNHLAVRDVLLKRPDLRDEYGAVKMGLAASPDMDIDAYIAGKSDVLQKILAAADLTVEERVAIRRLNDPSAR